MMIRTVLSLLVVNVGGSAASGEEPSDANEEEINEANKSTEEGKVPHYDDHLTPAERRYIEQKERIDVHRLAKKANKSHRDRIQDFNQYLANMSEHYDIPKVGPFQFVDGMYCVVARPYVNRIALMLAERTNSC